jgi:hypothetical protein
MRRSMMRSSRAALEASITDNQEYISMTENDRRVNRATIAVHSYHSLDPSDDDRQTVLVDLLTDLQHYAASHPGVDFAEALRVAVGHFEEEA